MVPKRFMAALFLAATFAAAPALAQETDHGSMHHGS
ncbi:DUF305 domain-containing protein, partial [Sinorhizobium meliloti]